MTTTTTADDVLTAVLGARWKAASGKFVDLAKAIPDGRFASKLVKGTRTCGEALRHVAFWNRYFADSLNQKAADDSGNELKREDFPDKSRIVTELERTNREIAKAMNRNLDGKALELISMALEHVCEHYGQLAMYARMLEVVPPASRS